MIKDLVHRLEVEHTIEPRAFTDSQTADGETVGITGFRRVMFIVSLGAISAAGITITFEGQNIDDSWDVLDDDDLVSDDDVADLNEIAADDDETEHTFGLKVGKYKAVRAKVDADTESGAGDLAVLVAKAKKYDEPV